MQDGPRLSVRHLSVSFGSNLALDSLDLDVCAGRMVALLGANGSGKSTTVKALTGINPVAPGAEIRLNGQRLPVDSLSPGETRRRGIRVVHQESPLVADLTVAEAMAVTLGFPTTGGMIRWGALAASTERSLAAFGIDLDPSQLCSTLTAAERALVSLAIALGDIPVKSAVLILDEATASLSTSEAERFLDHVREAADNGLAVLMVTHRLPEVRRYCDEMLVLRDGIAVEQFDRETFDERGVVRAMVGAATEAAHKHTEASNQTNIALHVDGVEAKGLRPIDASFKRGEIVGVAGRPGGGAAELLRALGGIETSFAGRVTADGRAARIRSPRDAIRLGMFYISADRLTEGGVATMTVAENLTLPRTERYGLGRRRASLDVDRIMTALDVRPADSGVVFGSLSGGNQQKVLLGRWLLLEPQVLLLDDPTVGVDPNTREVMFGSLRDLARAGTTVLLRSSEPEQLARLCDRVIVLTDGRITDELAGTRLTTEEISLATFA